MTNPVNKFAAAAAKAVEAGADQTTAKTGGAELPAEGPCNLRLVGYIELGKHESTFQGRKKTPEKVSLIFEVSGRNHPPVVTDNGTFPHRIEVSENLSLSDKARFFKLFQLLNYKGTAKIAAELLGEPYRGRIVHREYTGKDGKQHKVAELFDKKLGVYTIQQPRVEETIDGEPTGNWVQVKVAPALSDLRCFLWNHPDMEQWDSLFIDGTYEERKNEAGEVIAPARSKNKYQLKIRTALNFAGSPVEALLQDGGIKLDLPEDGVVDELPQDDDEPETPAAKPAAAAPKTAPKATAKKGDPLAGIAV